MKKFLLICLTALLSTMAWAYDFSAENEDNVTIYYNVVDGGVEVTYETSSTTSTGSYTGELTIPSTVTYEGTTYDVIGIGESACYKPQMTKITIPGSVTYIGDKAFYASMSTNTKLEEVVFDGDGLESIGLNAFLYAKLTSLKLPSTVSSMGDGAFKSCTSLVSANIPASLTYVPSNTFNGCSKLESVVFDGEVDEIEEKAFYGCKALKDVVLPDSVAIIGNSAFYNCSSLTEIALPARVDSIAGFAFYGCSSLATVISYNPEPPVIGGEKVFNGIADECVLYVPEGCKEAYLAAEVWQDFGEDNIVELAPLEEGTKFQVGDIYYNVVSTEDLYVEVTYGNDSFRNATESYTGNLPIPDTAVYNGYTYHVIGIGDYAFYGCKSLTGLSLPASGSVGYIGYQSFYNCSALENISLPEGLKSIGYQALFGNTSLVNLSLPEGLDSIAQHAFRGCTKLESAILPNSVSALGDAIYYGCTALKEGNIPLSLTVLATSTFTGCSKLETVVIGQENSEEEQAQTKVETINNNAFYNCTNLANVTIPKTVTSIDYYAFYGCENSLKSIEIPELVESIGANAFKNCKVLEEVICLNQNPPVCDGDGVFSNIPTEAVLYVPAGCKEAYEAADVWKDFFDIQELAPFSCEIDPEDGETVPELSQITFSNAEGIYSNDDFDSEEPPVLVYNASGEVVAYIDNVDATEENGVEIAQTVNLNESVIEAGDYTVLVAANLFYVVIDGRKTYNSAMTLSYTVEPEEILNGLPEGYLVDPENESYLESLSSFTLSLESEAALTVGSDFSIISVTDHWGQEVTTITLDDESDYGKVICTLDEEISEPGAYFINFNKGALYDWSDNGGPSPAFMLTYYVTAPPVEYSFDPEDGSELSSLVEFSVACEDGIDCSWNYVGYIDVEDELGNHVAYDVNCETTYPEDDEWGDGLYCTITLNTEIDTAGKYTITIPEGYFIVGSSYDDSEEIVISYTITTDGGTETGISGISINGENVEGIYSVGGQKLNVAVKGVNIVRTKDGDVKKILVK